MFTYKLKQIIDILVYPILWSITLFMDNPKRLIIQTWMKLGKTQIQKSESATENWQNYHNNLAKKFYINAWLCWNNENEITMREEDVGRELANILYKSNIWENGNGKEIKKLVAKLIGVNWYLYSMFNYFDYLNAPTLESF